MSTTTAIVLALMLLAINAFFVGAEFAVMSTRRSQIEPLVAVNKLGSKSALYAIEHVSQMLACCQLGITLASTGLGVVAEPALAALVEGPLVWLGLPAVSAHVVGTVLALVVVVAGHVIIGEMVPKNLALAAPERSLLIMGPAIVKVAWAFHPLVAGLDYLANGCLRLLRVEPRAEVSAAFTVDEVASIVELSQAEGVLDDELGLLSGALEFCAESVAEVMVPLDKMVTVSPQVSPQEVERVVAKTGFSRFLVQDQERVEGYLHIKDILSLDESVRDQPIPAWKIRKLPRLSLADEVENALAQMQRARAHLAIVCGALPEGKNYRENEDSNIEGVVFLEDIIEELIGEVQDSLHRRD